MISHSIAISTADLSGNPSALLDAFEKVCGRVLKEILVQGSNTKPGMFSIRVLYLPDEEFVKQPGDGKPAQQWQEQDKQQASQGSQQDAQAR